MGICFSEPPLPPVQQATVIRTSPACRGCGGWVKQSNLDYCEACLQKNANSYLQPSAPPMYPTQQQYQQQQYRQQQPQYTYAVQYPPQQTYYQQQPLAFISTPYPQQQQRQMGTGTAIATGFVVGALMDDMLDPS